MEENKKNKIKLVFVCTGNTCRSPMAEFMFKAYLKERGIKNIDVSSAGLYAQRGDVLNEKADAALELLGIKHSQRKAKTFTVQMALDSDLVIGMTAAHAAECGTCKNVRSFEDFGSHAPVSDPYGGTLQDYLDCAAQMRACFDDIAAYIQTI